MFLAALLQRSFARGMGIAAGISALLIGLQVLLVLIARSQQESQSFGTLAKLAPGFVQRQWGDALPLFLSFDGLVSLPYFHPVVVLTLAVFAAFVATELASDVEEGHVDLLLARALPRRWLVTRSLVAMILFPALLVGVMLVSGAAALTLLAPEGVRWPRSSTTGSLAGHLLAVSWCVGAAGLAAAACARRRMTALGGAGIGAVALYLLEVFGTAWAPASPFAVVSPFHYFQGASIVAGTAGLGRDLGVLLSFSLVSAAIAYWRFNTRDV